jgi:hypothetical protein
VGNGGKAQSRFVSSGDGGLARDGIVIPREGAWNGGRLDDVLNGEKALEPRPLLVGVSSFGETGGRPGPCQLWPKGELVPLKYLLHSFVIVAEEAPWPP